MYQILKFCDKGVLAHTKNMCGSESLISKCRKFQLKGVVVMRSLVMNLQMLKVSWKRRTGFYKKRGLALRFVI